MKGKEKAVQITKSLASDIDFLSVCGNMTTDDLKTKTKEKSKDFTTSEVKNINERFGEIYIHKLLLDR